MKNNHLWYAGYLVSVGLIAIVLFSDLASYVDMALCVLASAIFSVSHVQLLHEKMIQKDEDYRIECLDERHILIKEKAGNSMNIITTVLLGITTCLFIAFDYIVPAIIIGVILLVQPFVLIVISNQIEKKM